MRQIALGTVTVLLLATACGGTAASPSNPDPLPAGTAAHASGTGLQAAGTKTRAASGGSHAAGHTPSPSPTSSASSGPTARTSTSLPIPWDGRVVASASRLLALLGHHRRLYATTETGRLERISPTTGAVIARSAVHFGGQATGEQPVAADGLIWLATSPRSATKHGGTAELIGARPGDLHTVVDRTFTWRGESDWVPSLATSRRALYLAAGRTVLRLSPHTGAERARIEAPAVVRAVTARPNDTAVYIAYGKGPHTSTSQLAPPNLTRITRVHRLDAVYQLLATDAGVFTASSTGMAASVTFATPRTSPLDPVGVNTGGGGIDPFVILAHGKAWSGGPERLVCASPRSGHVLKSTQLAHHTATFALAVLGRHVYATYSHGHVRGYDLVRLTPPSACGVSG